jgi:hypothetical protein
MPAMQNHRQAGKSASLGKPKLQVTTWLEAVATHVRSYMEVYR